ncbi:MAG: hypothetical protein Q9190_000370 [Brigantiaea leucoxantha]
MSSDFCELIDDSFGPYAEQCRGGFDFTLLFEETLLSILPLALLISIAPLRISYLIKRTVLYTICGVFQIALIALWARPAAIKTKASVANAVVSFVGTLVLGVLSSVEHQRTVRPSLIAETYLGLSLLFDAARVRTLWLQNYNNTVAALTTVSLFLKLVLLCVEALEKRSILRLKWKSQSPEATSGIVGKLCFLWLNRLFRTGFSRSLSIEDMLPLDKHLTSGHLFPKLHKAWRRLAKRNSLLIVYLKELKWHLLSVIPPRLGLIAFNFAQPFLIERAIHFSQQPVTSSTTNVGYGLIGAYFLVYCGIAFTTGQYQHLTYRAITMARGGLVSMLFAKTSTLKADAVDSAASLTLMSADIERITNGWQTMHEVWANVVEVALAIYLLQRQLGVACTIPLAVAIASFVGSIFVMKLVVHRQGLWLEAIEKRISATTTMLGSMKRVKMCGLADVVFDNVHTLRLQELRVSKGFRRLLIGSMFCAFTTPIIAPVLTFTVFALVAQRDSDSTLSTSKAFTSLSLFALLTEPLSSLIMALTNFAGSFGCFARIQKFLETKEHEDKCLRLFDVSSDIGKTSQTTGTSDGSLAWSEKPVTTSALRRVIDPLARSDRNAIVVEDGSFGWNPEKEPLISSIQMRVPQGRLTMIVGRVGCGKTTLLKALLGEVPPMSGVVRHFFPGSISYCDQSPFHMNGTIRDSIIAFSEPDERWYSTVVEACALDEDLRQMPLGDRTRIGSKGIALSGGQGQRLALARALYARNEICIFDDILSGLDLDTENRVFHNLLGSEGLLRRQGASVVLASSSNKRLPFADHIIVLGQSGKIGEQGSFQELTASGGFVSSLDLPPAEWTPKTTGISLDQLLFTTAKHNTVAPLKEEMNASADEFEANKRTGDLSMYIFYARSVGTFAVITFIVAICSYVFCISFPQIWLGWWSEENARTPNSRLGYWLGIYAFLGVVGLASLVISCWQIIVTMVPQSGKKFHQGLLRTVLAAPMSFFSTTDIGITLNRFSQDLQLIDMDLPLAALNFFASFVQCVAQVVLIGVSSSYAAISFPLLFIALYLIQKFYLRTSRQLRFLDLEAKSPLYSQFSENIVGVTTVRAFGWQGDLERRNRFLLDQSQRPFYLLFSVQRWLQLVLDLLVAAVAVLLMILVVELRGVLSAAYVGIAFLNVILFSQYLKIVLYYWTLLETHIGAVARVKNFTTTVEPEESPHEGGKVPPDWPAQGAIEVCSVSASYGGSQSVLKDLNLSIQAGEKIGICGRTGSGKSSFIMAIFRMLELQSGSITIDGVDISTIPRQEVRSRIIGLPQDVFLLNGSVRLNIDPHQQASDKAIVAVLKDVKLWGQIQEKGGLGVPAEALNLSHGQKQLFCLAQALLRPSSILILDEATSRYVHLVHLALFPVTSPICCIHKLIPPISCCYSVDDETDALIQRIVRQRFAKHTIIAVAHKLETIIDFDKVAVLDQGTLREFDNANVLLSQPTSMFRRLYESGGS